uniref:Uncharacterized protein n=1 Tax=Arundo donax TaxID=35708 RepID=A0A0A8YJE8_ARUDO
MLLVLHSSHQVHTGKSFLTSSKDYQTTNNCTH